MKKFAIEYKLKIPIFTHCYTVNMEPVEEDEPIPFKMNDWCLYKKYKTKRDRDKAFVCKTQDKGSMFDYRKLNL